LLRVAFVRQRYCIKENRGKMGRLTVFFGLMLVLSCGAICSSALTTFPLEDKLQELELRLEAKIGAKNAQLEEKVTQMEAQLELNVSPILLSLIQSFTVGKTLLLFYDRMN
jgi:hypothetical protein